MLLLLLLYSGHSLQTASSCSHLPLYSGMEFFPFTVLLILSKRV